MNEKVENALFEARPYVEYYEDVKRVVEELWGKATNEEEFLSLLEEEIKRAGEPFKTDLKIFLQKFRGL